MASRKTCLLRGMHDGIPIGLGYFAVAFALGTSALANGITPLQGGVMSILNLTSAGQATASIWSALAALAVAILLSLLRCKLPVVALSACSAVFLVELFLW